MEPKALRRTCEQFAPWPRQRGEWDFELYLREVLGRPNLTEILAAILTRACELREAIGNPVRSAEMVAVKTVVDVFGGSIFPETVLQRVRRDQTLRESADAIELGALRLIYTALRTARLDPLLTLDDISRQLGQIPQNFSTKISRIEEKLRVRLFERGRSGKKRSATPTKAGADFENRLSEVFRTLDGFRGDIQAQLALETIVLAEADQYPATEVPLTSPAESTPELHPQFEREQIGDPVGGHKPTTLDETRLGRDEKVASFSDPNEDPGYTEDPDALLELEYASYDE